jgi:hypothetical protein
MGPHPPCGPSEPLALPDASLDSAENRDCDPPPVKTCFAVGAVLRVCEVFRFLLEHQSLGVARAPAARPSRLCGAPHNPVHVVRPVMLPVARGDRLFPAHRQIGFRSVQHNRRGLWSATRRSSGDTRASRSQRKDGRHWVTAARNRWDVGEPTPLGPEWRGRSRGAASCRITPVTIRKPGSMAGDYVVRHTTLNRKTHLSNPPHNITGQTT